MYVIIDLFTGVTTQGEILEDAIQNLKEAVELYLEELPELKEELSKKEINLVGTLSLNV